MKKDWMVNESELDDIQIKIIMSMLDKPIIVTGCAGSGKSVLALIKAQHIQQEQGNNYKIIVFTKALSAYMNIGKKVLNLNNPFTYHWRWEREPNPSTDYMIVDEIQDFSKEEIEKFITSTNKGFIFFGDTAQSIYNGIEGKVTMPVEQIKKLCPRDKQPKECDLYYNYRLPIPVAKFVQHIGVNLPPFDEDKYKSLEKEAPYILQYNDFQAQVTAVKDLIKDADDVAILLPNNKLVKSFCEKFTQLGQNYEVKYKESNEEETNTLNFNTNNPKIMTYHSAKGLQFETIILPWLEVFNDDINGSRRKSLYTAMTRTYKNLYIMYSGNNMPAVLKNIPKDLYKTTVIKEIDLK